MQQLESRLLLSGINSMNLGLLGVTGATIHCVEMNDRIGLSVSDAGSVEIGGLIPGGEFDQVNAFGAVTIDGTLDLFFLNLGNGYTPAPQGEFIIINDDGKDGINGTFDGLPEAAALTFEGIQGRISYGGGDGNDVTIVLLNGLPLSKTTATVGEDGTPTDSFTVVLDAQPLTDVVLGLSLSTDPDAAIDQT